MINYKILDESIQFYDRYGFQHIESPWTTSEYAIDITAPKDAVKFQFKHNDKCLVASGEQSFLYLYLKGFLPPGRYQTITPCFRFEQFDLLHTKYFMKNELMVTDKVDATELDKVITAARKFYSSYLNDVYVQETEAGFDLVCEGIELGSYGIRSCEFLDWIYGTACAEPRLSTVIQIQNKKYGIPQNYHS